MKIKSFEITNYRSLIDFKVDAFSSTTIFYGLNNAGKSNILCALSTIFKSKVQYDPNVSGGFTSPKNFYDGILQNFSGEFFNQNDSLVIDFAVELTVNTNELKISEKIKPLLKEWPAEVTFLIKGNIKKSNYGDGSAEINTAGIVLEGISIYDPTNTAGFYFPTLLAKDNSNRSPLGEAFTELMDLFNDCVHIIGNERDMFMVGFNHEIPFEDIRLTPSMFKHFLHSLYLNKKKHSVFEEIDNLFASEPFGFGRISFSKEDGQLDIMIKENNSSIRLPIKSLGSGVLQILYVITEIVCNPAKIICIEELEQNLSPGLQDLALRKLQTMIGSVTHQIILSSHSPVFAKVEYSESIYLIEKKDGKTVISEKIGTKLEEKAKMHFAASAFKIDTYSDDVEVAAYKLNYKHEIDEEGKNSYYTKSGKLICHHNIIGGEIHFHGAGLAEPQVFTDINYRIQSHSKTFIVNNHDGVEDGSISL